MKKFLYLLMLVSGLSRQLVAADTISVEDISLLKGTPVAGENWLITDYQEDEQGPVSLWLESGFDYALVLFPRQEANDIISPWGESFRVNDQQIIVAIQAATSRSFEMTRFGGKLIASGQNLLLQYEPTASDTIDANFYDLISEYEILISGKHHASIITSAGFTAIYGPDGGANELYGPTEATTWQIDGSASGTIKADSWQQAIQFAGIESLIGSEYQDDFHLLDSTMIGSVIIDGAGGEDTLMIAEDSQSSGAEQQTWSIKPNCTNQSSTELSLTGSLSVATSDSTCAIDFKDTITTANFSVTASFGANSTNSSNLQQGYKLKSSRSKSGILPWSLIISILLMTWFANFVSRTKVSSQF